VLGVVDNALALGSAVVDRVHDHRQVLLASDPRDLLEVERPGLADEAHDRREGAGERAQPGVLLGRDPAPPGHAEGGHGGVLEALASEQLEELRLLRVRGREAGFDEVDAEPVESLDDSDLLGRRQRHALPLHAVAEGGVV
jgi:hypothetical protein